ncbi:hypothetical protein Ancab_014691 [Ancistrocladus abbreviatus]
MGKYRKDTKGAFQYPFGFVSSAIGHPIPSSDEFESPAPWGQGLREHQICICNRISVISDL